MICALAWTFTTSLQTSQASEDSALPSTQDWDNLWERFGGTRINLEETKLVKAILQRFLCVCVYLLDVLVFDMSNVLQCNTATYSKT